ncbi:MAG: transposase [Muribaculaceae bacterium]|nr:transposase [Muribaculaceae bacterium]
MLPFFQPYRPAFAGLHGWLPYSIPMGWSRRDTNRENPLIPYNLYLKLVDIFNRKSKPAEARLNLARWYNEVEKFGDDTFNKVLETFENHYVTIINYFEDRLTNASAESFNAKIKAFRAQFRGVGGIKFFMYRLATLYS